MKITVVAGITCPTCGAPELNPKNSEEVVVRGFKVHMDGEWHSQCLRCAGGYDEDYNWVEANLDRNKGWFSESDMG